MNDRGNDLNIGHQPAGRVEVNEHDIRELEQNLKILRDRNRDFANNLDKVKQENEGLKEYAARMKAEGERRVLEAQAREEGFARGMAQTTTMGRVRTRDIPYRKPDIYKTGENFKRWLKSFKIFADTAQIPPEYRINTLITFIDTAAQMKIETLNLDNEKKRNPEDCYEHIARAIEGTTLKNECRARLFKLKQGNDESVTEFATKLVDLTDRVYDEDNSPIKDQIMLDCFIAGLKSDRLAYDLIKDECDNFQAAYQRALDLESIYAAALRDRTGNRDDDCGN